MVPSDKSALSAEIPTGKPSRFIWLGLGLATALFLLVVWLPFLAQTRPEARPLPVYGQIADFSLTNQNGTATTRADLSGHVWVADIIFTRCPGPCLKMTRQMRDLQAALPSASQAKLVSLTTDPEFDTPSVLKTYAQRFEADPNRWLFLTGTPKQIANLATDSLKLAAISKPPGERESAADLFVHSTIFVVVDKHSQLRGIFETTGENVDPRLVQKEIVATVSRLERES